MTNISLTSGLVISIAFLCSCHNADNSKATTDKEKKVSQSDTSEYYLFRPKVEKEYGYSHAVKIGDEIKISGAVSMDDNGVIVAPGNRSSK